MVKQLNTHSKEKAQFLQIPDDKGWRNSEKVLFMENSDRVETLKDTSGRARSALQPTVHVTFSPD